MRRSLLGGLELAPAWSYAMSATIPYIKMDVTASVQGGPVGVRRSDSESGLGDIVLMPLMVNYIVDPDLSMNLRVAGASSRAWRGNRSWASSAAPTITTA